jgi:hypothetical protein
MTIETKYNIGDEVWFMALCKRKKGVIKTMTIWVFDDGDIEIKYSVEKSGFFYHRYENHLFPTKEELLKSL